MSKFIFSLENALKYRVSLEEHEVGLLARAMQNVQIEEGESNKLNIEKQNYLNSYSYYKTNLTTMQQQEAYISLLDLRIKTQLKKLEQAVIIFKNQRERVVKASIKRKTLERLKEKCLKDHQVLDSKAEQKILDDIGIAAYCHRADN